MNCYTYDGPVMEFDTCIVPRWKSSTYAVSESKARSNLAYQFKKQVKRAPNTKITLPGKIILVERKENFYERERIQAKF